MKMKINQQMLSIPPYISTSWENIATIRIENSNSTNLLIIELVSGTQVKISNLNQAAIETIFIIHQQVFEQQNNEQEKAIKEKKIEGIEFFKEISSNLKIDNNLMDQFGSLLQHNLEQATSPDLPQEVLSKIAMISKTMGVNKNPMISQAGPHCNCPYCQIARAIANPENLLENPTSTVAEEEVSADDLRFRVWDIFPDQTSEKLYLVTNPLDEKEQYRVFLGQPMGCTCGKEKCEHIQAVLNS